MRLGKASAYGILATLHIAGREKEGPVQGREIASECGIPAEYLLKILQQLARVRVLSSERGRGGGFTLAKPAGQTTLLEIVEAIEGPLDGDLIFRNKIKISDKSRSKFENVRREILAYARNKLGKATIKQLMD
jgi:Rrf2 family protein